MSAVNLPFLDNPSSPPEKYSITGILSPDMVPGIRRNVVDFSNPNEPDASIRRQWNLYLMGLSRFQAIDEEDPLSYYQVAGEKLPFFGSLLFQHAIAKRVLFIRYSWSTLHSLDGKAPTR